MENFNNIIREYQDKIYRLVFSLVRNESAADEIVQNTFILAYKNIKKFRHQSSLSTWLSRIAINNTRNHYRKRKFFSLFYNNDDESTVEIEDISQNIEKDVERNAIMKKVQNAIDSLPSRQKEVFIMKHIQGMGIAHISEILEISTGSVKANIFKSVRNMRKNLGGIDEL